VRAFHFLENLARQNQLILFVGTKRQIKSIVETEARRCGMPFVSERWPGGLLTNYRTVRARLNRLVEIERWEAEGILDRFTKKEVSKLQRLKRKLLRNLDGIRVMDRIPACVVIVDPAKEAIAVQEANKVGSTVLGLVDTDADPDLLDLVVPCNDDSMKVVQILLAKLSDAVLEGKQKNLGPVTPEAPEKN
jgi:small subunit ribosomal protein S2